MRAVTRGQCERTLEHGPPAPTLELLVIARGPRRTGASLPRAVQCHRRQPKDTTDGRTCIAAQHRDVLWLSVLTSLSTPEFRHLASVLVCSASLSLAAHLYHHHQPSSPISQHEHHCKHLHSVSSPLISANQPDAWPSRSHSGRLSLRCPLRRSGSARPLQPSSLQSVLVPSHHGTLAVCSRAVLVVYHSDLFYCYTRCFLLAVSSRRPSFHPFLSRAATSAPARNALSSLPLPHIYSARIIALSLSVTDSYSLALFRFVILSPASLFPSSISPLPVLLPLLSSPLLIRSSLPLPPSPFINVRPRRPYPNCSVVFLFNFNPYPGLPLLGRAYPPNIGCKSSPLLRARAQRPLLLHRLHFSAISLCLAAL